MCYRYDGYLVRATIAARLTIKNRMTPTWQSEVNLTKIVRCQFGTRCDGSEARNSCRIEQRQLGQADRLEACLAIDLVVAWRIYYLNKLGREHPDVP